MSSQGAGPVTLGLPAGVVVLLAVWRFSKFVQLWSRRWTSAGVAVDRRRARDVMVAEAVIACDGGATINEVAEGSASTNRGPAGFAVAYRVLGGVSEAEDIVQR